MFAGERSELCGEVLDGLYRMERVIGLGGTGVVFEATRVSDGEAVAVKLLRPCFVSHPDVGGRLRREAEVARAVDHEGIMPMLDEGRLADGSPYLVMPLTRGESLSRILMRQNELQPAETAALCIRVLDILEAAHRAGYTHRDVKPEHVILDRNRNGDLFVQLIDFGVCASVSATIEEKSRECGRVFGTPTYVSPEQAAGKPEVDGRSDLFSLGVVAFEALTGKLPFSGMTTAEILYKIMCEEAPRVRSLAPDVSPGLDDIVARMLRRDPNTRWPSARVLARALETHAGDQQEAEQRLASLLRNPAHRPLSGVAELPQKAPERQMAV